MFAFWKESESNTSRAKHRRKRKRKQLVPWLQEFSKKVLWGCYIAWISVLIYSAVVMQMAQDLSSLPTMIDGATTVMRDGVIGYCIKAAIENAIKIALSKKEKADDDPPAG